jgi:hypothetical protein
MVLQKFGIMDYRSMETPMIIDLKKLRDSDTVDLSLYQKFNGLMMYLENTHSDICFSIKIFLGGT